MSSMDGEHVKMETPESHLKKLLSYKRTRNVSFPRNLFRNADEEVSFILDAEQKGIKVLMSDERVFLEKPKKKRRRSRKRPS